MISDSVANRRSIGDAPSANASRYLSQHRTVSTQSSRRAQHASTSRTQKSEPKKTHFSVRHGLSVRTISVSPSAGMSFGVSSVKSANLTAPALFILSAASAALDCVTGDAGWLRSFDDALFEDLHSIACDRIGAHSAVPSTSSAEHRTTLRCSCAALPRALKHGYTAHYCSAAAVKSTHER